MGVTAIKSRNNNYKKEDNIHSGHRSRLRRKLMNDYSETVENHELLELLLFYSITRRNTNEFAHELLEKFGSVSSVLNAKGEELRKVFGIKEKSSALISAVNEMYKRRLKFLSKYNFISSYDTCCKSVLELMSKASCEGTYIIWVNRKGGLLLAKHLKDSTERFEEMLFYCRSVLGVGVGGAIIVSFFKEGSLIPENIVLERMKSFEEKLALYSVPFFEYFLYNGKLLSGLRGVEKYEMAFAGGRKNLTKDFKTELEIKL